MKKREKLDVIFDILKSISDQNNMIIRSKLIAKSNLSPQMFQEYTEELFGNKLIDINFEKGKKYYSLRTKGYQFLEEYDVIRSFVNKFGIR